MSQKKMNILVAPNSMKGSLDAVEFAEIVEKAFLSVSSEFSVRKVPVADGGDFTGEILRRALNAEKVEVEVKNPVGKTIRAHYAVSGSTAVIEMADASGMKLLSSGELNPLKTSTFGTGQLIMAAVEAGCTDIYLGVGGSATVDGGMGMMEALGFRFFDKSGRLLKGNGENLIAVEKIQKPENLPEVTIKIVCDVDNPLLGQQGAASVFGPQKGATSEMVKKLEAGLKNWADLLEKEYGCELKNLKGAGAAGGISVPLIAYCDAEIVSGASFVLSSLNFESHVKWADVVITGEGKVDSQTLNNKAPKAVADAAKSTGKPVIAIGGSVGKDASEAFDGIFSITPGPVNLEESIKNSRKFLFDFSHELAKLIFSLRLL